jgi:cation/acetate symporter
MVLVSLATPSRIPPGVETTMVRLHTPESLPLDRGRLPT